ncbi:MAG: site-2 protease family protein [Christensenellales bacterium]|jgi:stage IV sporulation protein FB
MKIGAIRGVDLYLRPYILLFFMAAWLMGRIDSVLLAYAALAVHEAGHVTAARLMNMRVGRIELAPYGGTAHIDGAFELLPSREFIIAAAGPAVSVATSLITLGLAQLFPMDENLVRAFAQSGFGIGLFNLLPGLPLDGGRMMRAMLAKKLGIRRATGISAFSGVGIGALLIALSIYSAFFYGSLSGISLGMALAGLCIVPSAIIAARNADGLMIKSFTEKVHVDGIPTPVKRMAVSAGAPASQVLSSARVGEYYEFLVLDKKGALMGVVSQELLRGAIMKGAGTMADALNYSVLRYS